MQVGDPEELNALDQVFCKGRKSPLLIGSVKSNLGHSEPASGLCSVTKVLIAMETGIIPPNLHYYNPREGVEALTEGRLKVHLKYLSYLPDVYNAESDLHGYLTFVCG
jgi:fatty acid synthase